MLKKFLKKLRNKFLSPLIYKFNEIENFTYKLNEVIKGLNQIQQKLIEMENNINSIINKISLTDDIALISTGKFYIPNAPRDLLQNKILSEQTFPEYNILKKLNKYLNRDSVLLDIGANIGTHSIYWRNVTKVKKIYAFEPVLSTYLIFEKNIDINNLSDKINIYNFGLGDKTTHAKIKDYTPDNIGGTSIVEDIDGGNIQIIALDDIKEINDEEKIDFMKIDVEGFEKYVLKGGRQTIMKHKPIIFIESFPGEDTYNFTYRFFMEIGYDEPVVLMQDNYLFINKQIFP